MAVTSPRLDVGLVRLLTIVKTTSGKQDFVQGYQDAQTTAVKFLDVVRSLGGAVRGCAVHFLMGEVASGSQCSALRILAQMFYLKALKAQDAEGLQRIN